MKINLQKFEQTTGLRFVSISNFCFFDGVSDELYQEVRRRLILLLENNLWLSSRLNREKREVFMEFDENRNAKDLVDELLEDRRDWCID